METVDVELRVDVDLSVEVDWGPQHKLLLYERQRQTNPKLLFIVRELTEKIKKGRFSQKQHIRNGNKCKKLENFLLKAIFSIAS